MTATFYTIGYRAGFRKPEPLTWLIDQMRDSGVNVVIDIREKPFSTLSGFSIDALALSMKESGLSYAHRQWAGNPFRPPAFKDFAECMRRYSEKLDSKAAELGRLAKWLRTGGRVACLLCACKDARRCHRSVLSQRLVALGGLEVVHLPPKPEDAQSTLFEIGSPPHELGDDG